MIKNCLLLTLYAQLHVRLNAIAHGRRVRERCRSYSDFNSVHYLGVDGRIGTFLADLLNSHSQLVTHQINKWIISNQNVIDKNVQLLWTFSRDCIIFLLRQLFPSNNTVVIISFNVSRLTFLTYRQFVVITDSLNPSPCATGIESCRVTSTDHRAWCKSWPIWLKYYWEVLTAL